MSRSHRFQAIETFNRNGRVVVHVRDSKAGRDLWIHRVGRYYFQWNREDALIPQNESLRVCAREALNAYEVEHGVVL